MRLIKGKFEKWLKAKQPDEIVGENRDCNGCPIANFYFETSGGCEVVIFDHGDCHWIDRGYDKRPLPSWASKFVVDVDDVECAGQVSAALALELLAP